MSNTSNITTILLLDGLEVEEEIWNIVPMWFLKGYLWIIIAGGVTGNILLICTILRCRARWKKDRHYSDLMVLLLHIAMVDIATLTCLAPFEIVVLGTREGVWGFVPQYCSTFMGLDVLLGLAMIYLLVALSLHAVTARSSLLLEDSGENGVRVPLSLVWLLAISLSIPEFCLSGIIIPRPNYQLCTLLNNDEYRHVIHGFLAVFRVGIPVLVLLISSLKTVFKLCNLTMIIGTESARLHLLRISLVLTMSYGALSLHRSVFTIIHVFLSTPATPGPDAFRQPPLANVATSQEATLGFAMMHYALSALRPVLCYVGSRHVRPDVCGCFSCCCCGTRRNRPS